MSMLLWWLLASVRPLGSVSRDVDFELVWLMLPLGCVELVFESVVGSVSVAGVELGFVVGMVG